MVQAREVAQTREAAAEALRNHEAALEALEDEYQAKLLAEYRRVEQLEQQQTQQQAGADRWDMYKYTAECRQP